MTWADDAECATSGLHPSAWDHDASYEQHVAAARVCGYCPVAMDCLAAGIADREYGMRAGRLLLAGRPRRIAPRENPVKASGEGQCGSPSGARQHRRLGEDPCLLCRTVEAERARIRRARRKDAA